MTLQTRALRRTESLDNNRLTLQTRALRPFFVGRRPQHLQGPKPPSQLAFVPSMANSQDDRIAVFRWRGTEQRGPVGIATQALHGGPCDLPQEVSLLLLVGIRHGEVRCLIRAQHGVRSPDHLARCPAALAIAAEPGTPGWIPWSYAYPRSEGQLLSQSVEAKATQHNSLAGYHSANHVAAVFTTGLLAGPRRRETGYPD